MIFLDVTMAWFQTAVMIELYFISSGKPRHSKLLYDNFKHFAGIRAKTAAVEVGGRRCAGYVTRRATTTAVSCGSARRASRYAAWGATVNG